MDHHTLFEQAALAMFAGELEQLDRMLSDHPDLAKYQAPTGHSTLLQVAACEEPHLSHAKELATLLVQAGSATTWPLISAAGCNGSATLEVILNSGVPVDTENEWTPLDEALYWNNPNIVQTLIERGASVKRLRRAAGIGDVGLLKSFFESGGLVDSAGPLAAPFADTVDAGQQHDPQAIIDHAFVMAANCGQLETAKELLTLGAGITAQPPGYHWRGSALHAAVWRGDTALVSWLLENGADPAQRDGHVNADAVDWAKHHNQPHIEALLTLS